MFEHFFFWHIKLGQPTFFEYSNPASAFRISRSLFVTQIGPFSFKNFIQFCAVIWKGGCTVFGVAARIVRLSWGEICELQIAQKHWLNGGKCLDFSSLLFQSLKSVLFASLPLPHPTFSIIFSLIDWPGPPASIKCIFFKKIVIRTYKKQKCK